MALPMVKSTPSTIKESLKLTVYLIIDLYYAVLHEMGYRCGNRNWPPQPPDRH